CGSTGRWCGCSTGTSPSGRCPRPRGSTTTCARGGSDLRPSRSRRPRQTILPLTRTILPLTRRWRPRARRPGPWWAGPPSWTPCARPGGRPAAMGGTADTLQAAAGGGDEPGGIVVVEDVHWADSSSLGLLAYLVRRLTDWPLLLVLSWQPEQAGRLRVLRTALAEAEGQSLGQTVEPGPFGPEAIGTLLGLDDMPRIDVSRLLAETRGLPMLVREDVEALRAVGEPEAGAGEPGTWRPPASGRDLLRT